MRRSNAKVPSLLAGLLYTPDGEKLVPSHAVKAGRRYRYYIERRLTCDEGVGAKGARYAAEEVEATLIECLKRALTETLDFGKKLGVTKPGPSEAQQLQKVASQITHDLLGRHSARQLLLQIVSKVTLGGERLEIELKARGLAQVLGLDHAPNRGSLTIAMPCRVVRRGQEQKLILPPHHAADSGRNLDPALIRAVAEARLWWTWILEGQVTSLREIVARTKFDPPQVTRRLRLAFLAPDLVRRIMAGTQPADLTLERLTRRAVLPLSWHEQAKPLG